jgi:hypothetical protein
MAFGDFISSLFGGDSSSTPAPSTPAPSGGSSGGGVMDLLMPALLGGGSMLASKLLGRGYEKDINKATKNIRTGANTATNQGNALVNAAAAGKLTPAQQAAVDQMKTEQNARNAQYLASLGIPVSTANVEMQNKTDQDALAFAQKLIDQSMQEGTALLGLGGTESTSLLTNAMKQKADLAAAISEIAKQMGLVLNQPTQKPQDTPAKTIASGAQALSGYQGDPYIDYPVQETTV